MWFEPVSTLDLIIKGLLIGVVASAPMGPVGVLCIQRTLNKGRWYGFVTGIGASFSDIIYALITGFGMSFVVDFIENKDNMFYLQMAGSIMLFFFGWYTYRCNPAKSIRPTSPRKGTLTDFYNITGAHSDQHIAMFAVGEKIILNFVKGAEIPGIFSHCSKTLADII